MNSFILFVDQCTTEESNYPVLNLLSKWQTQKPLYNTENALHKIVATPGGYVQD